MKILHAVFFVLLFVGEVSEVFAQEDNALKPTNLGDLLIPEPLFVDGIQFGSFGDGAESYATLVEITVLKKFLQRFPIVESLKDPRDRCQLNQLSSSHRILFPRSLAKFNLQTNTLRRFITTIF